MVINPGTQKSVFRFDFHHSQPSGGKFYKHGGRPLNCTGCTSGLRAVDVGISDPSLCLSQLRAELSSLIPRHCACNVHPATTTGNISIGINGAGRNVGLGGTLEETDDGQPLRLVIDSVTLFWTTPDRANEHVALHKLADLEVYSHLLMVDARHHVDWLQCQFHWEKRRDWVASPASPSDVASP